MKLAIYQGSDGAPRSALVVAERVFDLQRAIEASTADAGIVEEFVDPGDFPGAAYRHRGLLGEIAERAERSLDAARSPAGEVGAVQDVRLLAPVLRPSKILCVGLNYRDHIREVGAPPPKRPHVFSKLPSALIGPDDPIHYPTEMTKQVDYEVELAVVVGARTRNIDEGRALEAVLGYTIANDVSARDWQFDEDNQLTLAKGFDTFFPLGPWLVTPDELGNPQACRIRCSVNGEIRQDTTTEEMVFGVGQIISLLSMICTLEAGDVIATGTPAGVGVGRRPQVFLSSGDELVCEIEGIGVLRNVVSDGHQAARS